MSLCSSSDKPPDELISIDLQLRIDGCSEQALQLEVTWNTTVRDLIQSVVNFLSRPRTNESQIEAKAPNLHERNLTLAEIVYDHAGDICKERSMNYDEHPAQIQALFPDDNDLNRHGFLIADDESKHLEDQNQPASSSSLSSSAVTSALCNIDSELSSAFSSNSFLGKFFRERRDVSFPDLTQLSDLSERTLVDSLKQRFQEGRIYTYAGPSILVSINPYKFFPLYNPKVVSLYQNHPFPTKLPPHVFAIADEAYQEMLRTRKDQCVVISGESGSGKTECTHFLLHHLTALSSKGTHANRIENSILSAAPVLEAFGNAKTVHNNNSSRFGKYIQVFFKPDGKVSRARVQKYLLEKSRIPYQATNERNYHMFYYLFAGCDENERSQLHLRNIEDYTYLNQSDFRHTEETWSEWKLEFERLKHAMELVGFTRETRLRVFSVLSAILHIGNICYTQKFGLYHHDECVQIKNLDLLKTIAGLLKVREDLLHSALVQKCAIAHNETLVINFKLAEAISTRDALAKLLYSSLFDWIVNKTNTLLSPKTCRIEKGNSIGVLDIFGFENFPRNSFEQFCINYANEHLQYYFNQHVFKYEQDEYTREGIFWNNVEFTDNKVCLDLIESKPCGLISLLNEECSFPGATNLTLLEKYSYHQKNNPHYEVKPTKENTFSIHHYAGPVKYDIESFREKNCDLNKSNDLVCLLKSSHMEVVRELVSESRRAMQRWRQLLLLVRCAFAIREPSTRRSSVQDATGSAAASSSSVHHIANQHVAASVRRSSSSSSCDSGVMGDVRGRITPPWANPAGVAASAAVASSTLNSQVMLFKRNSVNSSLSASSQRARGSASDLHPVMSSKTKKFATVTSQFQHSLHQLMDALNDADPYFIRCIKSNNTKTPCYFDENTVMRQVRYTGLMETVRIRRQGYNVRFSFLEFENRYRILLKSAKTQHEEDVSNPVKIERLLRQINLETDNFQIGKQKIYMREAEKERLDDLLHTVIVRQVVRIQRWWRQYHQIRQERAALVIQTYVRRFLAQKHFQTMREAVILIQRWWRKILAKQRREEKLKLLARGNSAREDISFENCKELPSSQIWDASSLASNDIKAVGNLSQLNHKANNEQGAIKNVSKLAPSTLSGCKANNDSMLNLNVNDGVKLYDSPLDQVGNLDLIDHAHHTVSERKRDDISPPRSRPPSPPVTNASLNNVNQTASNRKSSVGTSGAFSTNLSTNVKDKPRTSQATIFNKSLISSPQEQEQPPKIKGHPPKILTSSANKGNTDDVPDANRYSLPSTSSSMISQKRQRSLPESNSPPVFTYKPQKEQATPILTFSLSENLTPHNVLPGIQSTTSNGAQARNSLLTVKKASILVDVPLDSDESDKEESGLQNNLLHKSYVSNIARQVDKQTASSAFVASTSTASDASTSVTYRKRFDSTNLSDRKRDLRKRTGSGAPMPISDAHVSSTQQVEADSTTPEPQVDKKSVLVLRGPTSIAKRLSSPQLYRKSSRPKDTDSVGSPVLQRRKSAKALSQISKVEAETTYSLDSEIQNSDLGATTDASKASTTIGKSIKRWIGKKIASSSNSKEDEGNWVPENVSEGDLSAAGASFQRSSNLRQPVIRGQARMASPEMERDSKSIVSSLLLSQSLDLSAHVKSVASSEKEVSAVTTSKDTVGTPRQLNRPSSKKRRLVTDVGAAAAAQQTRNTSAADSASKTETSSWNCLGATEFTDSSDRVVSSAEELRELDDFLFEKITQLCSSYVQQQVETLSSLSAAATNNNPNALLSDKARTRSQADDIFQGALREFRRNLISTYSVASTQWQESRLSIRYKELIDNFEKTVYLVSRGKAFTGEGSVPIATAPVSALSGVERVRLVRAKDENKKDGDGFAVIVAKNAFRSYMNEFVQRSRKKHKLKFDDRGIKDLVKRRKTESAAVVHVGHHFNSVNMFNLPTACEVCSSFLWPMERAYVCQQCKMTCHKKCYSKVTSNCAGKRKKHMKQASPPGAARDEAVCGNFFGCSLEVLIESGAKVPGLVDRIITTIEMQGLYTEWLYRKSGGVSGMRALRNSIENDADSIDWAQYHDSAIHIVAATLKAFLRELPEPLMTFEHYDDFMRAATLPDKSDQLRAIYNMMQKLPTTNHGVLARLFFHLARIAQHSDVNKMTAGNLAVVFAPVLFRAGHELRAFEITENCRKQIDCIQLIIDAQLEKLQSTLETLDNIDSAALSANSRLSVIRCSRVFGGESPSNVNSPEVQSLASSEKENHSLKVVDNISSVNSSSVLSLPSTQDEEEEQRLSAQLMSLRREKASLTKQLPSLSLQRGMETSPHSSASEDEDDEISQMDDLMADVSLRNASEAMYGKESSPRTCNIVITSIAPKLNVKPDADRARNHAAPSSSGR